MERQKRERLSDQNKLGKLPWEEKSQSSQCDEAIVAEMERWLPTSQCHVGRVTVM